VWNSLTASDTERTVITGKFLNSEEEFSNCFGHYVQQPRLLKDISLRKYEFFRQHIFYGKEYPNRF
jgi:hypothetical protein